MSNKEIKYRSVKQNESATHGTIEHVMARYEGLSRSTVKSWISEMREHPDFEEFVDNPTYKIVLIDYEGFRLFFKWKSRNRYRAKKESLAEMLENIKIEKRMNRG